VVNAVKLKEVSCNGRKKTH